MSTLSLPNALPVTNLLSARYLRLTSLMRTWGTPKQSSFTTLGMVEISIRFFYDYFATLKMDTVIMSAYKMITVTMDVFVRWRCMGGADSILDTSFSTFER